MFGLRAAECTEFQYWKLPVDLRIEERETVIRDSYHNICGGGGLIIHSWF